MLAAQTSASANPSFGFLNKRIFRVLTVPRLRRPNVTSSAKVRTPRPQNSRKNSRERARAIVLHLQRPSRLHVEHKIFVLISGNPQCLAHLVAHWGVTRRENSIRRVGVECRTPTQSRLIEVEDLTHQVVGINFLVSAIQ